MGSSIAKTSCVTSSASLPRVSGGSGGDKPSTAVLLVFTLEKTAEKEELSLKKETITAKTSLKTSIKEKAASDQATPFESSKDQFRHFLSSENAASNSSTPKASDLTQSDSNLPVVVSASIAANYATVLLDSLSVLPTSDLTNFRGPSSSSVDQSGSVSRELYYSSSTVIPVWTANMLGNAYGGGYVITPSIFVTHFPDSPSSIGIPPGYELSSSKCENIHPSRSFPTQASVGTGCVFATFVAGPSKEEEATLRVSTSASVLHGFIDVLEPTTESETANYSTTKIPKSNASNHGFSKPVAAAAFTTPSLASSSIPVNETGRLNTSLLLLLSSSPASTANLAPFPTLISPLVNQKTSSSSLLAANQSVVIIGAYSPTTSVLDFKGLAIRKSFDSHYSLGFILCIMAMSFIL